MTAYPIAERAHAINGVPGRMYAIHEPQTVRGRLVHRGQKWVSEPRKVRGYGTNGVMHVHIRFDDDCSNGHQTFSMTVVVYTNESRRRNDIAAGGCMHDEIESVFPELAPLIRWHLVSTDSPMHYVANTIYHASDRDSRGYRKGEACDWEERIVFQGSPVSHAIKPAFAKFIKERMNGAGEFRVVAIAHAHKPGEYKFAPKYTFVGFAEKWHECPFDEEYVAQEWAQALNTAAPSFVRIPTRYSEGKERNLDAARRCGVWPDATDEQLCAEPEELKAALLARLPALVAAFRADMNACGFLWEPEQAA